MFKPSSYFLTHHSKVVLLLCIFFFFHLCFVFVFVLLSSSLWPPAGKVLLSWLSCLSCFSCVLVTFPYGVLGQVWYLIASIPDICLPPCVYCLFYNFLILVLIMNFINVCICIINCIVYIITRLAPVLKTFCSLMCHIIYL